MIINGTLWYTCVSWSSHCGIFHTYPLFRSQTALGVLSVDTTSLSLYGLFCLHAVILHEIFLQFTTKYLLLHELKKTVLQSSVGIAAYSGKSKPSHFYAQWVWPQPGGCCVLSEGAGVLPGFRALPKILQELILKIWVVSIYCLSSH